MLNRMLRRMLQARRGGEGADAKAVSDQRCCGRGQGVRPVPVLVADIVMAYVLMAQVRSVPVLVADIVMAYVLMA